MKDVTADKAKKISQKQSKAHKSSDDNTALHHHYGRIGISAVAAAVRYQGGAKNPAYAPAGTEWRAAISAALA